MQVTQLFHLRLHQGVAEPDLAKIGVKATLFFGLNNIS